jgi:hypothetical protein
MQSLEQLVNHVRVNNPSGRGRPHDIAVLMLITEVRKFRPKRLTDEMRLELHFKLDEKGIIAPGVLDTKARCTCLMVKNETALVP